MEIITTAAISGLTFVIQTANQNQEKYDENNVTSFRYCIASLSP